MPVILDGTALAAKIRKEIRAEAAGLPRRPGIAVILVGDDPASRRYVRNKTRDCEECGFLSQRFDMPEDVAEEEVLGTIGRLNADPAIDGILVQLPLPAHLADESSDLFLVHSVRAPFPVCRHDTPPGEICTGHKARIPLFRGPAL